MNTCKNQGNVAVSLFSQWKKKKEERKENLRLPGLQVDTQNGH